MTHKETACIADGEDIHLTHNPLLNAHTSSPKMLTSQIRRRRRAISDSGASKHAFSDKSKFRNYKPYENVSIRVAEGSSSRVLDIGEVGSLENVLHVEGLVFDLLSEPALARAGMTGSWSGLSQVVMYPFGKVFLEATLCDDDLHEINPVHLCLPAEDDECVAHNAMLTKGEAVELLHRTLGNVAVQRIEDAINTGHVD